MHSPSVHQPRSEHILSYINKSN